MRKEKELSLLEKKRLENFNKKSEELKKNGYKDKILTINVFLGNILSFILVIPFAALLVLFYYLVNNGFDFGEKPTMTLYVIVVIINVIVCTTIHELIHGITYSIFTENHLKDIEYGFILKTLTPYCVCLAPLKKNQYILGILMPGIVLGVLVAIIFSIIKVPLLFFSGLFQLFCAGGDIILASLVMFNKSNDETLYIDHPVEVGVVRFSKE